LPARAGLCCPGELVEGAAGEVCETRSVRKRGGKALVKASDCEVPTRASRSFRKVPAKQVFPWLPTRQVLCYSELPKGAASEVCETL
jgi:hypothetical protein